MTGSVAEVEAWWFRTCLRGEQAHGFYGPDDNLEGDFEDLDSVPAREWEETENKARAMLTAIGRVRAAGLESWLAPRAGFDPGQVLASALALQLAAARLPTLGAQALRDAGLVTLFDDCA